MLRTFVGLLILLNISYWAWSQGFLADLGAWAQPTSQSEPQRLQRQMYPERLQLLATNAPEISVPVTLGQAATTLSPTEEVAGSANNPASPPDPNPNPNAENTSPPAPVPAPPKEVCLQTAHFSEKDRPRVEAQFKAALPSGSWSLVPLTQPARWIVYTGKLSGPDAVAETKAELRERKIGYRDVPSALQPGLALGTFATEEAALQGVRDVARNGYKGAKAVMERSEYAVYTLRLPEATDELKAKAAVVLNKQGEGKAAKSWQNCNN